MAEVPELAAPLRGWRSGCAGWPGRSVSGTSRWPWPWRWWAEHEGNVETQGVKPSVKTQRVNSGRRGFSRREVSRRLPGPGGTRLHSRYVGGSSTTSRPPRCPPCLRTLLYLGQRTTMRPRTQRWTMRPPPNPDASTYMQWARIRCYTMPYSPRVGGYSPRVGGYSSVWHCLTFPAKRWPCEHTAGRRLCDDSGGQNDKRTLFKGVLHNSNDEGTLSY